MLFHPRIEVILTRRGNVVYLHSEGEWLPCAPEVVSGLCRRSDERINAAAPAGVVGFVAEERSAHSRSALHARCISLETA
jgi:hypothetical protein